MKSKSSAPWDKSLEKHFSNKMLLAVAIFLSSPLKVHCEVYLSKEEALSLVLGKDTEHLYVPKKLDAQIQQKLEDLGLALATEEAHFFVAKKGSAVTGYALIDSEIGKHLPITYIVGISPEGKVSRVEMMIFREVRGWEARERQFMVQFENKGRSDNLKIGSALRNVSGATLSSIAISKGVKRALTLWEYYFGNNTVKQD